jgi:predicted CXXCH cytochrome family protein
MKFKLALLAVAVLAIAIVVGVPAFAGIQGSAHDFSSADWSGHEICSPCHIPHNASSEAALWARGSLADLGPYELWDNEDDVLGKRSLTCLSCHDGTLALEGVGGTTFMEGHSNIGTDLTNDHPVGVAYTTSTAGTRWKVPTFSSPTSSSGSLGNVRIYLDAAGTAYRVECASCHNVHGSDYGAAMLRDTNYGSNLCLSCHIR